MNRVGHAFIKQRMRKEDGIFAGEVTGHYYFRDFYYADNGFIPALLILELMSKKNQSLRDLLRPYRERYFISARSTRSFESIEDVPKKLAAIEARYKDATLAQTGRPVGGLPGLALQRARRRTPSRCCASTSRRRHRRLMERKRDEVTSR